MTFTVRQSGAGRAPRTVTETADEATARCVYAIACIAARKGTMTELQVDGETVDAQLSERAHGFKTTTARCARARGAQLGLFG